MAGAIMLKATIMSPPVDRPGLASLLWGTVIGFGVAVLGATLLNLDLSLAQHYYDPTLAPGWFLQDSEPWESLYRYGNYPALLLAFGALLGWGGSYLLPAWRHYRRSCLIVVCVVALAPGVLVNGILKPLWGRPRPAQVALFGGAQPYRPWWQPGGPGAGHSFPSGHAAMGYVLMVSSLVIRPTRPGRSRLLLVAALAYGTLLGWTRIVQGGHFLCDVLWSGGVTALTIACLQPYCQHLQERSGRCAAFFWTKRFFPWHDHRGEV